VEAMKAKNANVKEQMQRCIENENDDDNEVINTYA
jgi:hypothetical protein